MRKEGVEMAQASDSEKVFALIGYPAAGKTSLAVGLYATARADLVVRGRGEDTENYLCRQKAALESGCGLAPTSESERPTLHLRLQFAPEKGVNIAFTDYMGARAFDAERFRSDIVGNPDGALIVLNAAMPIWTDPPARNAMLGQLKELVAYLGSPAITCHALALVVLAPLRPVDEAAQTALEAGVAELTHAINMSVFKDHSRTFRVRLPNAIETATPSDASASDPFVWLVDEGARAACRARYRRYGAWAARGALAVALTWGGIVGWDCLIRDRGPERALSASFHQARRELEAAIQAGDVVALNAACHALESSRDKAAETQVDWALNARRLEALKKRLDEVIAFGRLKWIPAELNRLTTSWMTLDRASTEGGAWSVEEVQSRRETVEHLLAQLEAFAASESLTEEDRVRARSQSAAAARELTRLIEAGEARRFMQAVETLSTEASACASAERVASEQRALTDWAPQERENKTLRQALLARFEAQSKIWRTAYETQTCLRQADELAANLSSGVAFFPSGARLKSLLEAVRQIEVSAESVGAADDWLGQATRQEAARRVVAARATALVKLRGEALTRARTKGRGTPHLTETEHAALQALIGDGSCVPVAEAQSWMATFVAELEKIQADWWQVELQARDDFLASLASARDGYDLLQTHFAPFYSDHADSPFLRDAVMAVHARLTKSFLALRAALSVEPSDPEAAAPTTEAGDSPAARYARQSRAFMDLSDLCRALVKTRAEDLKRSCWYRFAADCLEKGELARGFQEAFSATITVTQIEAKVTYESFPYGFGGCVLAAHLKSSFWNEGLATNETRSSFSMPPVTWTASDTNDWQTIWSGHESVTVNDWGAAEIQMEVTDVNTWPFVADITRTNKAAVKYTGTCRVAEQDLAPGEAYEIGMELQTDRLSGDKNPKVAYRVYLSAKGLRLDDLWPQSTDLNFEGAEAPTSSQR